MKRAVRVLEKVGVVLSLLICVGAVFMCFRSLSHWDLLTARVGRHRLTVNTWPDVANIAWSSRMGESGGGEWRFIPSEIPANAKVGRHWNQAWTFRSSGGEYDRETNRSYATTGVGVMVPFWAIAVVAGLMPGWVGWRSVSGRWKRRPGICPKCGYDLRATPQMCPECGEAASFADGRGTG